MGDGVASTGDVLSLFERLGLREWDLGGLRKDDVNVRDKNERDVFCASH